MNKLLWIVATVIVIGAAAYWGGKMLHSPNQTDVSLTETSTVSTSKPLSNKPGILGPCKYFTPDIVLANLTGVAGAGSEVYGACVYTKTGDKYDEPVAIFKIMGSMSSEGMNIIISGLSKEIKVLPISGIGNEAWIYHKGPDVDIDLDITFLKNGTWYAVEVSGKNTSQLQGQAISIAKAIEAKLP